MPHDDWNQVQALFETALDRPPDQRAAFLRTHCPDEALRAEVEALLAAADGADAYFDDLALRAGVPGVKEAGSLPPPSRVGPYRLERELGRGGMGVVYLAERDDDQFRKRVALKLVKRGMDTDEILRRFRYERQILAGLDHPGIARLLDGGVSEDGRPYFVMEYVDGRPIHRFCDAAALPTEARLRMVEKVGAAVQYAHRNLVVHRDLKPSNILVTDDPGSGPGQAQVKLLDFGIAKLLGDRDLDVSAPRTKTGAQVLTPAYAAPEQIREEAVTTATDVYALGVVLYELLTGRRPFDGAEREAEPRRPDRPSTVVTRPIQHTRQDGTTESVPPAETSAARGTTPERLHRRLKGDLDVICLKALHPDPERRYASAGALVNDLRRHRDGLPVQARPDTLGYRLRTFARRNRTAVGAAIAVMIALVMGLSVALWQAHRATVERDTAQEVTAFVESLFDAADPYLAGTTQRLDTLTVRDFLDRGAAKVRRELADRPALQARMFQTVGRVYHSLGVYDSSRAVLEEALALHEEIGDAPAERVTTLRLLGTTLLESTDLEVAKARTREALALARDVYGSDHPETARLLNDLGVVLKDRGDLDGAEEHLRRALALFEAEGEDVREERAIVHSHLGRTLNLLARYEEAETHFRRSVALRKAVHGEDHPRVAIGLQNLALALRYQGTFEEAAETVRAALAINEKTFGPNHTHVADNLSTLGSILRQQGNLEGAEIAFRRAIDLQRTLYGPHHRALAVKLHNFAVLLRDKGDYPAAESTVREALAVTRTAYGPEHMGVGINQTTLGSILHADGRHADAEAAYREAIRVLEAALPKGHQRILLARVGLGACLSAQERYEDAERLLVASHDALRTRYGADDRITRRAQDHLVDLYEAWNKPEKAAAYRSPPPDDIPSSPKNISSG